MSYSSQLGATDSQLGNFLLGAEALGTLQLSESLTLTESLLANIKGLAESETLIFAETLSFHIPQIRVSLPESLVVVETLTKKLFPRRSNADVLAFDEELRSSVVHKRTLSESLTLTENFVFERHIVIASETLSLSETLVRKRIIVRVVSETIVLTETLSRSNTLIRSLSETINFVGGFTRRYGNGSLEIYYPEVRAIKKQNLFVLKGFDRVITLPNPQFDDSESLTDQLTVYRSMSNQIYTYVKKQELRRLTYSFRLDRQKSIELRKFFDIEKSNKIEIQNHKTEIWVGYLAANPTTYTATQRAELTGERVEISLDFEAIRVM